MMEKTFNGVKGYFYTEKEHLHAQSCEDAIEVIKNRYSEEPSFKKEYSKYNEKAVKI